MSARGGRFSARLRHVGPTAATHAGVSQNRSSGACTRVRGEPDHAAPASGVWRDGKQNAKATKRDGYELPFREWRASPGCQDVGVGELLGANPLLFTRWQAFFRVEQWAARVIVFRPEGRAPGVVAAEERARARGADGFASLGDRVSGHMKHGQSAPPRARQCALHLVAVSHPRAEPGGALLLCAPQVARQRVLLRRFRAGAAGVAGAGHAGAGGGGVAAVFQFPADSAHISAASAGAGPAAGDRVDAASAAATVGGRFRG
eukprot:ctg_3219.g614